MKQTSTQSLWLIQFGNISVSSHSPDSADVKICHWDLGGNSVCVCCEITLIQRLLSMSVWVCESWVAVTCPTASKSGHRFFLFFSMCVCAASYLKLMCLLLVNMCVLNHIPITAPLPDNNTQRRWHWPKSCLPYLRIWGCEIMSSKDFLPCWCNNLYFLYFITPLST